MMHCPDCGAADVTRAAIEWEKGTQVSVRGGRRRLGALQQSLSAYKLAPPDTPRARTGWALLMVLVGAAVALRVWASGSGLARNVGVMLLALAVLGPIVWCVIDANRRQGVYTRALEHWSQLWVCNRCGHLADDAAFRGGAAAPMRVDPAAWLARDGAPPMIGGDAR